jgi:hypothetical protein
MDLSYLEGLISAVARGGYLGLPKKKNLLSLSGVGYNKRKINNYYQIKGMIIIASTTSLIILIGLTRLEHIKHFEGKVTSCA